MLTTFDVNKPKWRSKTVTVCKWLDYEKKDGPAIPVIRGNLWFGIAVGPAWIKACLPLSLQSHACLSYCTALEEKSKANGNESRGYPLFPFTAQLVLLSPSKKLLLLCWECFIDCIRKGFQGWTLGRFESDSSGYTFPEPRMVTAGA